MPSMVESGPWTGSTFSRRDSPVGRVISKKPARSRHNISWYRFDDHTESASPTLTIETIDLLAQFYTFRDYVRVSNFLMKREGLGPFLLDAYLQIVHLGEGLLRPALELVIEPESGVEKLFLLLPTALPVKDARRILREFDNSWWLDASQMVSDDLCLDLEYV